MPAAASSQSSSQERLAPILVIEDEPGVRAFLRRALERRGYRVVCAASGTQGLQMLEAESYLGVISDIRMPGGVNGADVHQWICHHRPEMRSRIIFITGDTASEETFSMLKLSGAPCVEKPFRASQLTGIVEQRFGKP
jgi:DNA-binding response OmpR family regulator